jgi:hypothetical protein
MKARRTRRAGWRAVNGEAGKRSPVRSTAKLGSILPIVFDGVKDVVSAKYLATIMKAVADDVESRGIEDITVRTT